ncbi:MAG: gliding motility-associated ABC transporter substrate-binding protein GldG [Ferruginibacter sp.]
MALFKKNGSKILWLPAAVGALVLVNWLASMYHTRIDFTNEKRFTLSKPTKTILRNLDEVVQVDIFLKGDFPSGFKKLANSTGELLNEFKEIAGSKLQYNYISPEENVEGTNIKWADTLSATGLFPINLKSQIKAGEQQQLVYPYAMVRYKGNVVPVQLFEKKGFFAGGNVGITPGEMNSAEAMMEYKFSDAINRLSQTEKQMVAYATGNGEPMDVRVYDLAENIIPQNYNLQQLNLRTAPLIPDTFKLLLLVKPAEPFTPEEKLKIDQFVMRGGRLLVFADRLNAEMDSLRLLNQVIAYDRGLELDDLLFKYGARINPDLVLAKESEFLPFDVNGNGQFTYLKWNYFPLFESSSSHVINKNLGIVSGRFVNSIDTVEAEGIKKTILLETSANGKKLATPALISGTETQKEENDASFNKADIPVAVLLEGKFTSLYNNRLSKDMADSLAAQGKQFISQSLTDNKIIVVADGDMVLNTVSKNEPLPMGVNPFTIGSQYAFQPANREFLQNCIDYLVNPSDLSEAKAKDYTLRLLDTKKMNEQRSLWQLVNIAAPVALVFITAVVYQWRRKRKYSK